MTAFYGLPTPETELENFLLLKKPAKPGSFGKGSITDDLLRGLLKRLPVVERQAIPVYPYFRGKDDGEDEDEDDINPDDIAAMTLSMTQSILLPPDQAGIPNVDAWDQSDMTQSVIGQIEEGAISIALTLQTHPHLADLIWILQQSSTLQLDLTSAITQSASPTLLRDLNELVRKHRVSLKSNPAEMARFKSWLRWLLRANGIFSVIQVYNSHPPIASAVLDISLKQFEGIRRLMNLLRQIGIPERFHGKIIQEFLLHGIQGSFSVSVADQPISLLLSMLTANPDVLQALLTQKRIQFNRDNLFQARQDRRKRFPTLLRALDQANKELESNSANRQLLSDAMLHTLKHEPGLLKKFGYTPPECLEHSNPESLLSLLNRYAATDHQAAQLVSSTIISLLHMPCLITTLAQVSVIEGSQLTEALQWLTGHHEHLLEHVGNNWQVPILQATLVSFARTDINPDAAGYPQPLINLVAHWLQQVHANNVSPHLVVAHLVQLYPGLLGEISLIPPCESEGATAEDKTGDNSKPVRDALEKVACNRLNLP